MQIRNLKKALVILSVLFLFNPQLNAQTYSNKESSILSFTVGMTSSNLIKAPVKFKSGILASGGLAYALMLNDRWNVAIEALFTGKAFKNDSPIIKYRYYFTDIPVYAQLKFGENVRVNAGLQYSIGINGQRVTIDPSKANGVNVERIDAIKSSDYGVLAGVEFDISKQLSLGARYTLSGSTFLESNGINFGVFQLSFKYSPIRTYRVFFQKKETKQ